MTTRAARFNDLWRSLERFNYRNTIVSAQFNGLAGIENKKIFFNRGPVILIGGNGVGKSTFALAIAEMLSESNVSDALRGRLDGSDNSVTLDVRGAGEAIFRVAPDLAGGRVATNTGQLVESRWLDPANLAHICRRQISDDANFSDNLSGVTPVQLNNEELEAISYITGRTYLSCAIYEISDYGDMEVFPYIQLECAGVPYGSERMGFGELCLIISYWALRRATRDSIFILEEPETHVSPRSQAALMDMVAKFCVERGLLLVITTHSPTIVRRFPVGSVWMLTKTGNATTLVNPVSDLQIQNLLGTGVAQRGAMFIEEEGARLFLSSLLRRFEPQIIAQFELIPLNGYADIDKIINSVPKLGNWCSFIGIYDGDQRTTERYSAWPIVYLPGDVSPDQLVQRSLVGCENRFAELLTMHKDTVMVALNAAEGLDFHDWSRRVQQTLQIENVSLWSALTAIWIEQNSALAKSFVDELKELVR